MKRLNFLTSICLGLGVTTTWGMGFKTYINPLKLPYQMSTSEPPVLRFTPPGEMSVGLLRACGDGDVERFSRSHPDFDFAPHAPQLASMDVTMGYWIVPDGADPTPTDQNFFTIARKRAPIAEQTVQIVNDGTFRPEMLNYREGTPIFKNGQVQPQQGFKSATITGDQNGMALLATDLINLHEYAKRSYGTQKKFRIYAGAFACLGDQDTPSKYKFYSPSAVETNHALSNPDAGLLATIRDALNSYDPDSIEDFQKNYSSLSYTAQESESIYSTAYKASTQRPLKFVIAESQSVQFSSSDKLWNTFLEISKLSYPTFTEMDTDKLDKYRSYLRAHPLFAKIGKMNNEISFCQNFGINIDSEKSQYRWESFPMNLSCKYFHQGQALADSIEALFNPKTLPDEQSFKLLKKEIASRFYTAAAFEATQKKMNTDDKIIVAKSNCFKKSPVIKSVLAAFPFEFRRDDLTKSYSVVSEHKNHHPEYLFAILDFKSYFNNDKVSIWGQLLGSNLPNSFNSESWSILLPLGDQDALQAHEINKNTFKKTSINIMLRIRSIGGHCPMFC